MNANELRQQAASLEQAAHMADDRSAMQADLQAAARLRRQADRLDGVTHTRTGTCAPVPQRETREQVLARGIQQMERFFSPEQHALREKKFKQMLAQK